MTSLSILRCSLQAHIHLHFAVEFPIDKEGDFVRIFRLEARGSKLARELSESWAPR